MTLKNPVACNINVLLALELALANVVNTLVSDATVCSVTY